MNWLNAIRSRVRRTIANTLKIDIYSEDSGDLVRHCGLFREERVALRSIQWWRVTYEMCVDIIEINLDDGTCVVWLDTYNDLIEILSREAGSKRLPSDT